MNHKQHDGFTLLEILIALFIFTILSMMMVGALHNIIGIQSHAEKKSDQLRQLQIALLMMSRDIEQAVNRPILNTAGREEPAFFGDSKMFTLTHTGYAVPLSAIGKSHLQRVRYAVVDSTLIRMTWPSLDLATDAKPAVRFLMPVARAYFEYLDKAGKFHNTWPLEEKKDEPLPRAINIHLTLPDWGSMSQLYLINVDISVSS